MHSAFCDMQAGQRTRQVQISCRRTISAHKFPDGPHLEAGIRRKHRELTGVRIRSPWQASRFTTDAAHLAAGCARKTKTVSKKNRGISFAFVALQQLRRHDCSGRSRAPEFPSAQLREKYEDSSMVGAADTSYRIVGTLWRSDALRECFRDGRGLERYLDRLPVRNKVS